MERAIRYLETLEDNPDIEAGGNDYARELGSRAREELEPVRCSPANVVSLPMTERVDRLREQGPRPLAKCGAVT